MHNQKSTIKQFLLSTLSPNTQVIKQSEEFLKNMENEPLYPLILADIILENDQNFNNLDFLSVLALSRLMIKNYK